MLTHLPASTEILGMFVDALEAGRYATGAKGCALRDRTGRRCFAGGVRTRHWCCRLSGLLEFVRTERLVDDSRADDGTRALGMFLPFAAAMRRWDAFGGRSAATLRAHLRVAALELATKIQLLAHAGYDFGVLADPEPPPMWLDPTASNGPLVVLRVAAGTPTLKAIGDAIGFGEHAVGRWFTKGERPSRQALQVLAKYFAKLLERGQLPIYRSLYWHYAMADVLRRLEKWATSEDANAMARVTAAVARCRGAAGALLQPDVRLVVASLISPPSFVVDHAIEHGASHDWAQDAAAVEVEYGRAGVEGLHNPVAQLDLVMTHLPRKRRIRPSRSVP